MPAVDCPSTVLNARSGSTRENRSWMLGRVLRDWEKRSTWDYEGRPAVSIFRFSEEKTKPLVPSGQPAPAGRDLERNKRRSSEESRFAVPHPKPDLMWYTGVLVMVIQWAIAAVVGVIRKDWLIMTITIGSTVLSLAGVALPQWKQEKWSC